jgi:hypothetical protein
MFRPSNWANRCRAARVVQRARRKRAEARHLWAAAPGATMKGSRYMDRLSSRYSSPELRPARDPAPSRWRARHFRHWADRWYAFDPRNNDEGLADGPRHVDEQRLKFIWALCQSFASGRMKCQNDALPFKTILFDDLKFLAKLQPRSHRSRLWTVASHERPLVGRSDGFVTVGMRIHVGCELSFEFPQTTHRRDKSPTSAGSERTPNSSRQTNSQCVRCPITE